MDRILLYAPIFEKATDIEVRQLQRSEAETRHSWEHLPSGEIVLYKLSEKCQGPRCSKCGVRFCLLCNDPMDFAACTCVVSDVTSGPPPTDHVYPQHVA
jgi:hypothetical protein